MSPRLRKAFKLDCDFAASAFRRQGRLMGMFVLHGFDRGMHVLPALGSKDEAYRLAILAGLAFDAEAVSIINEAWALVDEPRMPAVRPSESERRIEVVSVMMVTREEVMGSAREILRTEAGVSLGPERVPRTVIPIQDFRGRSTELLAPIRPDPAGQELALLLLERLLPKPST